MVNSVKVFFFADEISKRRGYRCAEFISQRFDFNLAEQSELKVFLFHGHAIYEQNRE
jgi:hypothetical protein